MELRRTHVHLTPDGAAELLDADELWADPASIDRRVPNWLVAAFPITADDEPGTAELHPHGDELLHVTSGALDVLVEGADPVRVEAGGTAVVPRGRWHRLRGRSPGLLVSVTYGRGTQHA